MSISGRATFVGVVEPEAQRPRSVVIVLAKHLNMVNNSLVPDLGVTLPEGVAASAEFAQRLFELSQAVGERQHDAQAGDDAGLAARLEESLTLTEATSEDALDRLRAVAAPLRARLTKEFVQALRFNDFLRTDGGAEPALTFQESDDLPPVLWDMMYEGKQSGAADWRAFWGFRVPVSHWSLGSRTAEVRLRGGMFAGTNEDLRYAGREIDLVAGQLQAGLRRRTIADYFLEYVRRDLGAQQMKPEEIDAWLEPRQGRWLYEYLDEHCPATYKPDRWKVNKIVEMFTGADFVFDVLHFACHAVTEKTAFLSELQMKVAGEKLVLPAGLISSDLKVELESASAPGPLVFLNACATVEPGPAFQPASFPSAWIKDRGAVAVLGSVCPVPDYFAHAFALEFYGQLLGAAGASAPGANTLGTAFLATRRHFMERHRNPLGLAYVLYADRDARLARYLGTGGGA